MNSNNTDEDNYWALVEAFVESANQAMETLDMGIVSAALLNAAARFNAYVLAASSLDANEFAEDLPDTTNYLTGRYRDLLKEHLEDYKENYKKYIRTDADAVGD